MNINNELLEVFNENLGTKLEQLVELISEVKLDMADSKNSFIEGQKAPTISELRKVLGVKPTTRELREVQKVKEEQVRNTTEEMEAVWKKINFVLNGAIEEVIELLGEMYVEEV